MLYDGFYPKQAGVAVANFGHCLVLSNATNVATWLPAEKRLRRRLLWLQLATSAVTQMWSVMHVLCYLLLVLVQLFCTYGFRYFNQGVSVRAKGECLGLHDTSQWFVLQS